MKKKVYIQPATATVRITQKNEILTVSLNSVYATGIDVEGNLYDEDIPGNTWEDAMTRKNVSVWEWD